MITPDERRLLIYDAIAGDVEKVCQFLRSKADDFRHFPSPGRTALSMASAYGLVDIVRELLKHEQVDVNEMSTTRGKNALTRASLYNHVAVVRELLKHDKVNVNAFYLRQPSPLRVKKVIWTLFASY
jgi:ankyrin repeat protein